MEPPLETTVNRLLRGRHDFDRSVVSGVAAQGVMMPPGHGTATRPACSRGLRRSRPLQNGRYAASIADLRAKY